MTAPPLFRLLALVLLALAVFGAGVWYGKASEVTPAEARETGPDWAERRPATPRYEPRELSDGARMFVELIRNQQSETIHAIGEAWQPSHLPYAVEALHMLGGHLEARYEFERLLAEKTGTEIELGDVNAWYRLIWASGVEPEPDYADYKAEVYRWLDHRFHEYFAKDKTSLINLAEVRWGGVYRDGIPPLRQPKMVDAELAGSYLADSDVVFGIEVNGDARAYPKRILAWHEMFVDEVGGLPVAGVYCTLCGTVILYETDHEGVQHELGTSGFLYRSNKLMYDKATKSLWSTLRGTPVIGPLADSQPPIVLPRRAVVTTTWGEWKTRHPDTQVLSIRTGHNRDYSEGAAYRDYFATDELMFAVPESDTRLDNKREVLALTFPEAGDETLAIDTDLLNQNPVYHGALGPIGFVVLTDPTGANRVYDADGRSFVRYDGTGTVTDDRGQTWSVSEDALERPGERLDRLPAQRAFWFGWRAAFPDVRLIH
ncbi:MAG: DUF3179 domain-containing protein [Planctomycetota bacterium]